MSLERAMEVHDAYELYPEHLEQLKNATARDLAETGHDGLVVTAGHEVNWHRDDAGNPHKPNSEFMRWAGGAFPSQPPVRDGTARFDLTPGHAIHYSPDAVRPTLVVDKGNGVWALESGVPDETHDHFDVVLVEGADEVSRKIAELTDGQRVAHNGPADAMSRQLRKERGAKNYRVEPKDLMNRTDFGRKTKTDYEIACIRIANEIAYEGHTAAQIAFLAGRPETDVFHSYLMGIAQRETGSGYTPIVAFNTSGRGLHHFITDPHAGRGSSMLIDAGAVERGYIADITRTVLAPDAHPVFRQIVQGLDQFQREASADLTAESTFEDVNLRVHFGVIKVLMEAGVIKDGNVEDIFESGLSGKFMPHSFGHHLGSQTHDKGELRKNRFGQRAKKLEGPIVEKWTNRGPYRERMVLTFEPGIYNIPKLLYGLTPEQVQMVNWSTLDQIIDLHGGVRIESNHVLLPGGNIDLTRRAIPDLTNV